MTAPTTPLPELEALPSLLSLPLSEYADTSHPVLKLHRLCDAVEILTRFFTTVALAEVRALHPELGLPESLLETLRPHIERPTLGRWLHILNALLNSLGRPEPLVVRELPDFVRNRLLSAFPRDSELLERNLLELRNTLVHGGGMTCAHASHLLQAWNPWLTETIRQLSFCNRVAVCHFDGTRAVRLAGPTAEAGAEVELTADLRLALGQRGLEGHVLLLREGRWLDLWPLCDYGRARTVTARGVLEEQRPAPLIYHRAEPTRLLYAALGVELPLGERADVVEQFRTLFRLNQPRAAAPDYEEEVRRDADSLLGRKDDLNTVKDTIKETRQGVLWLTGPGGIGKSFLLARIARDLGNDPKRCCRIVWRFRASDADRCNRIAFYRHAITRLAAWKPLGRPDVQPYPDSSRLASQLVDLLESAGRLPASEKEPAPPRVLLLLDGLDEIARVDPSFAEVPFQLGRPNVVWVCAGRSEAGLNQVFAKGRCRHLFPGGLPQMSADDIRGLLLDRLGKHKYRLLDLDEERDGRVGNGLVEAVVERAAGLPLYVHHLVEDILVGHFVVSRDLAGRLPRGLEEYYDDLLSRQSVGWLQALRTPLLAAVVWAEAPPDEELLELLMVRRTVLRAGAPDNRLKLREGLEALRSMLRPVVLPGCGVGYEPNHLTFREHVREDRLGRMGDQNPLAREAYCQLVCAWADLPAGHSAREYVLRHGPEHLLGEGWQAELYGLARNEAFLEAQRKELPTEPEAPLRTLLAALRLAMGRDDAPAMAEFCQGHARRLLTVREEGPLEALQGGSLERALSLAGLYESERRVLWYLLLLWALRDSGDAEGEREVQERLVREQFPRLTGWQGEYAAHLLAEAVDCRQPLFHEIQQRLLGDDDSLLSLGNHLLARNQFTASLGVARDIRDEKKRDRALSTVVQAQAQTGMRDLARLAFQQVLQAAQDTRDEMERIRVLRAVARGQAQAGLYDLALQTAQDIRDEDARADALSELALAQVEARLLDQGRLSFQQALQTAQDIRDDGKRALAQHRVAQAQAHAGLYDQALQTARDIQDERRRAWALSAVAQGLAQAGMHDQALQAARDIVDEMGRAQAMSAVAQAQAKAGMYNQALQAARDIRDEGTRAQVLLTVAQGQVQAGLYDQALQTARDIVDEMWRAQALSAVAQAQVQAGMHDQARLIVRDIRGGNWFARALLAVAQAQAQAGMHDQARLTFQQALQAVREIHSNGWPFARALVAVAQAQAQAEMHDQALQTVRNIQDQIQRARALLAVIQTQAQAGFYDLAMQTARNIQDKNEQAQALATVALTQARAGMHDQALETAREIQDEGQRARALLAVAQTEAQAGLYDLAMETARNIHGNEWKNRKALLAVAQAQARAGMHDQALQTVRYISGNEWAYLEALLVAQAMAQVEDQARTQAGVHNQAQLSFLQAQTAQHFRDEGMPDLALMKVALAQAQARIHKPVQLTFQQALQAAQNIRNEGERARALQCVAQTEAQAGKYDQALLATRGIRGEWQRARALAAVAQVFVKTGSGDIALEIAQSILFAANEHLVALAETFVEKNDRTHFKRLLPLAARYFDAAVLMCGLLARLYPQHASVIARFLLIP